MTTAEMLAVAVLKGDTTAIIPLLDELMDLHQAGAREIQPTKTVKIDAPTKNMRLIVYAADDLEFADDAAGKVETLIQEWLSGKRASLALSGVARVDVYEFPEESK